MILADDEPSALSKVFIYGGNRPVTWTVEPSTESRMFRTFPANLTASMATEPYTNHEHSYSLSMETFNNTPGLNQMMKVTSIDKLGNITFVDSMEAKNYPIYTCMFHPEYQTLDYVGPKKWKMVANQDTDEIAFRLSLLVNRDARSNSNRIKGA